MTMPDLREKVARIVDPEAFDESYGTTVYALLAKRRETALTKADAILEALEVGWRDIESAPKDGTEIILLVDGRAMQGEWVGASDGAIYARTKSQYNWFTIATQHDDSVTHWMPLPTPPEVK